MNIAFVCTNIQPFILERIHQIVSPISNFESTNLYNEYLLWLLLQLANWGKNSFVTVRSLFSFSTAKLRKVRGKISWNKLVKISDESNLGIPCKFRLYFLFAFATIALFLESLFFYWNPTKKVEFFSMNLLKKRQILICLCSYTLYIYPSGWKWINEIISKSPHRNSKIIFVLGSYERLEG